MVKIVFTILCIIGIIITYTWVGVSIGQQSTTTVSSSASSSATSASSTATTASCCAANGGGGGTVLSSGGAGGGASNSAIATAVKGVTTIDSILIVLLGITAFFSVAGNRENFTDYSLLILHAAMLISILSLSIACIQKLNAATRA
jgi:hypothetical protein